MKLQKILPYTIAILLFIIAALFYFHPVLKGQKLAQSDITQFTGMAKEIKDYRLQNKTEPYWTGTSFSGMPAYQISAYYPYDIVRSLDKLLRFLPRPADYTFLYFLSFFILMLALKVPWRLAVLGALGFGFSTYLIIIFIPGHNAKAHAIAYMPLVLAGVLYVFQKRYILGFFLTGLAMALEVYANHIQMTYYLGFCLLIYGVVELIYAVKEKEYFRFLKQTVVILAAVILGIGANAPRLMAMKEYTDYSTRGTSYLTVNADGTPKEKNQGLDKNYITQYSYSKLETFNLFIPKFMGGGTVEELDKSSNFYKVIEKTAGKKVADEYSKQVLTYWGDQPIIEAPAYIGAVICFLFFLGLFLVKGRLKEWLVAATLFSILLSWGKNFDSLTNLFIDYVPLYNKFRAVSSIQIIAELCVPILAVLGLKDFLSTKKSLASKKEALQKALYTFSGLIILGFLLAHSFSTFEGLRDASYKDLPGLLDAVIADRKWMLLSDTLKTLLFVVLTFVTLWFTLKNKLKQRTAILVLAVFVLVDLLTVNKRYLNDTNFTSSSKVDKPFVATNVDKQIVKDTTHYRVANFSVDPMQDASTSYFHHSIGGYHAAKMLRYKELFDYQIAKNNMNVLNILNTKYFIVPGKNNQLQVQQNSDHYGNAWFVNEVVLVNSADQEIQILDTLDLKNKAVIDTSFFDINNNLNFKRDSTAVISLDSYKVNELSYSTSAKSNQFAVFSEIYYKEGWNAYVDGNLMPHYRVNYVLRGLEIPAGNHKIVFKFEPTVIQRGSIISLSSYALLVLISLGCLMYKKKDRRSVV